MSEIKSLNDLLDKTTQVIVIDLFDHAVSMEDKVQTMFIDPKPGLYLPGSVDPILESTKKYTYSNKFPNNIGKVDLNKLCTNAGDILDQTGKIVITEQNIARRLKYFTTAPTVPAVAIKAASILTINYLTSLCQYTRSKNIHQSLEELVKPQFKTEFFKTEYEIQQSLFRLLDSVIEFVVEDTWHMYLTEVKGSTLIIEKGIDWRIYEWYRMKFEKENEDEQDRY